ncbi:hypothetical protein N9J91_01090 [Gammaproteobacteria bacterium]|nr:hypothetical protein [Gammaproteobacteria bacterium]
MSLEEARVIFVVYTAVILPIIIFTTYRSKLPDWVPSIYLGAFLTCALGWELWFTYGWIDGISVDLRRSDALNTWLPKHINWFMNSVGDAGAVVMGGLWVMWRYAKKDLNVFTKWRWDAFAVLMIWCIGQNIFVEMFLYHDQLSEGKALSWAPLSPLGPYLNPVLFEFNNRTLMLQSQIPWLILPAFIYKAVIALNKKN